MKSLSFFISIELRKVYAGIIKSDITVYLRQARQRGHWLMDL